MFLRIKLKIRNFPLKVSKILNLYKGVFLETKTNALRTDTKLNDKIRSSVCLVLIKGGTYLFRNW